MQCALHILHVVVALFDHFVYFPMRFCSIMMKENILVLSTSIYIFCNHFQVRERAGYALFHVVLLAIGCLRSMKITEGFQRLQFRPGARDGICIGSLLVPMLLTSQLAMVESLEKNQNKTGLLQSYVQASQLMSMCTVSVFLLMNRTKMMISFFLLFVVSTCIAATMNIQGDVLVSQVVVLVCIYMVLLFFTIWLFPQSFTLGEVIIVIQAIVLVAADSYIHFRTRTHFIWPNAKVSLKERSLSRSVLTYWQQILVIGSLCTGVLLLPVFYFLREVRDATERMVGCLAFYIVIVLSFFSLLLPWSYLMLGGVNPFSWVFYYVMYTATRKLLVVYWSGVVLVAITVVVWKSSCSKTTIQTSTSIRKYFHALALAVYLPGIYLDPSMTHLASSVAAAAFIFTEYVRLSGVPPLGQTIHSALTVFIDEKDAGPLILTHVYLLLGCALPLWLYPQDFSASGTGVCKLAIFSGLLSVGIGDTMAAVVGTRFGSHKWSGSPKSIEGTIASIVSQLIAVQLISLSGQVPVPRGRWPAVTVAIAATSLLESWTDQIDNVILSIFCYSLLLQGCR